LTKQKTEIVFIGRSNVGKSTLLNELFGQNFETGRRPGVTLEPRTYRYKELVVTDLPGFGFMSGVSENKQEKIKDQIVQYLEENADDILFAVQVIDASSFVEVVDRWSKRGEVPNELDLYQLCLDLDVLIVIAANKMDKVHDEDRELNQICDGLGLMPPWRQWRDRVAPVSAKKGDVEPLEEIMRERLQEKGLDEFLGALA